MAMSRSLAGTWFMTRPSIESSPEVMRSSPAIIRRMVDLPHPEGPSRTMNSPFSHPEADVRDGRLPGPLEELRQSIQRDHRHGLPSPAPT